MIVTAVLNLIAGLFHVLLLPIKISHLSDEVKQVFLDFLGYIAEGIGIVAAYTDFSFLMALFSVCLAVEGLYMGYHFIMWILRKIPFLGID